MNSCHLFLQIQLLLETQSLNAQWHMMSVKDNACRHFNKSFCKNLIQSSISCCERLHSSSSDANPCSLGCCSCSVCTRIAGIVTRLFLARERAMPFS